MFTELSNTEAICDLDESDFVQAAEVEGLGVKEKWVLGISRE